jgi:hypothetical protein
MRNAILLNGVWQTANQEIGVPGFQPMLANQRRNLGLGEGKSTTGFSAMLLLIGIDR